MNLSMKKQRGKLQLMNGLQKQLYALRNTNSTKENKQLRDYPKYRLDRIGFQVEKSF